MLAQSLSSSDFRSKVVFFIESKSKEFRQYVLEIKDMKKRRQVEEGSF